LLRFFTDISAFRDLQPATVAAALDADEARTVLLNSERIEQRFGNYGIDILAGDANLRRANLFSAADGRKTCRTYAVVYFSNDRHDDYRLEHELVLAGGSLGAVFKASGWNVQKQTLCITALDLDSVTSPIAELMNLADDHTPAVHVYRLLIGKNNTVFEYAIIAEAHHPDYLGYADLLTIFPCENSTSVPPQLMSGLSALFADHRLN